MPQIPINPFDNDRLKTRKVRDNLVGLGALPSDSSLHPSFLRSRRSAAALLDRALATLAPHPSIQGAPSNSRGFVSAMNDKFATAFSGGPDGGGADPGTEVALADFKNGIYSIGGVSKTLTEMWHENLAWGAFDPSSVIAGVGLSGGNPALNSATALSLMIGGFSIVVVGARGDQNFFVEVGDLSDYDPDTSISSGSAVDAPAISANNYVEVGTAGSGAIKSAATWHSDGRIVMSVLGGATGQCDPVANIGDSTDVALGTGGEAIIESITFYTPFADADLPTQSTP